ncbi:MAG: hypothetical protein AAFV62_10275 [Pseudomonadota bacterium]
MSKLQPRVMILAASLTVGMVFGTGSASADNKAIAAHAVVAAEEAAPLVLAHHRDYRHGPRFRAGPPRRFAPHRIERRVNRFIRRELRREYRRDYYEDRFRDGYYGDRFERRLERRQDRRDWRREERRDRVWGDR